MWQRARHATATAGRGRKPKEKKLFHYHDNNLLFSNACPHYGNIHPPHRSMCLLELNVNIHHTFQRKTCDSKSRWTRRERLLMIYGRMLMKLWDSSTLSSRLSPSLGGLSRIKENNLCISLIENLLRWLMMACVALEMIFRRSFISMSAFSENSPARLKRFHKFQ